jgi:hypothetical protein
MTGERRHPGGTRTLPALSTTGLPQYYVSQKLGTFDIPPYTRLLRGSHLQLLVSIH